MSSRHIIGMPAPGSHTVTVYTGNSIFSGTDANVFITLYGKYGRGEEHQLKRSSTNKNPFERGHEDEFEIYDQDLGYITHVKIRQDDSGMASDWLLNKVEVKPWGTDQKHCFVYRDWLMKNSKKNTLEIKLANSAPFPVVAMDGYIEGNGADHHTEKFKLTRNPGSVVLRRGQSFKTKIELAREYNPDKDKFFFNLKTGKNPQTFSNSDITVQQATDKEFRAIKLRGKEWGFKIHTPTNIKEHHKYNVYCEIYIPPTAAVGKYSLTVESEDDCVFKFDNPIYILFNPWCTEHLWATAFEDKFFHTSGSHYKRGNGETKITKGSHYLPEGRDDVYMEDEDELKEYVVRQSGAIYVGSYKSPTPKQWHFGQFEEISLDITMGILEKLTAIKRHCPISVSRHMTSMANSLDNDGILVGNWSGNYENGKCPTSWVSTPAILEKYAENCRSVKFGQCWVFSGILTTIMRCLGIPCRSVTNFESAHDTQGNCTDDHYLDENWDEISSLSSDSIWNFHVWNDVWMARPDLPPGYGGWQAIDATPQEASGGFYQMGPASLRAIKEGEITFDYDTGFALAEVNADTLYWQRAEDSNKWEVIIRDTDAVGKRVSTKAVGYYARNDITDEYKFPEGSILERASVKNALLKSKNPAAKITKKDVELDIVPNTDYIKVGDDAVLDVLLKNTCNQERNITLIVGGQVISYNGSNLAKLELHPENDRLGGRQEKKIRIKIPASHYMSHLRDDISMKFVAMVKVIETGQFARSSEIMNIRKPSLKFEDPPSRITGGQEASLEVTFENPLDITLTELELYMDGTIIPDRIYWRNLSNLSPGRRMRQIIHFEPVVAPDVKKKKIALSLSTKELGGIHGNMTVEVTPPILRTCGTTSAHNVDETRTIRLPATPQN